MLSNIYFRELKGRRRRRDNLPDFPTFVSPITAILTRGILLFSSAFIVTNKFSKCCLFDVNLISMQSIVFFHDFLFFFVK